MADYTVISDIGETLIALCSPGDVEDGSIHLSLFLYRIEENEHLKNQDVWQVDNNTIQYKPITLDLFYMMTAYSSLADVTEKNRETHRILGRAIQIFYDNAILKGSVLQGNLAGTDTEFRIVLTTMSMENITQMWSSFNEKSYKPSVFYLITPVPIDSTEQSDTERVIEKDMRYYQIK
jgi:hypothetical protein